MSKPLKLILAIDTSCDDTSAGIVSGTKVLANVIASQVELHRKWGGVVPDIARRAHQENIDLVIKEALQRASINAKKLLTLSSLDAVAVTYGPGLAIALEIGIAKAQEIALQYKISLIPVNHMEGHLLSSLGANLKGVAPIKLSDKDFPVMGLLISGGHTELVLVHELGKYEVIGETLDDAIGEAYDKVARMLNLGYPGGAVVTELAKLGDPEKFPFTVPMLKNKTLNFSYSGLKTAVFYFLKEFRAKNSELTKQEVCDVAASFEKAAIKHLSARLSMALEQYPVKILLVGGGVTASAKVRAEIRKITTKFGAVAYFAFDRRLFNDNGAMIGIAAHFMAERKEFRFETLEEIDREPRARLEAVDGRQ
ncbi:MAG: tRNA (adenosine(37)-N6)-threonylcarbamoyltransferase complex transferase subunit TsaD [bacterium]